MNIPCTALPGWRVRIIALGVEARVVSVTANLAGTVYKLEYWHDGLQREATLWADQFANPEEVGSWTAGT